MQELDYSWRFEAGTEYLCPVDTDPFQYMFENKKTTSFSVALYEYRETIPTLYQSVLDFAKEHQDWIQSTSNPESLWHFILDESNIFNGCHFWNNFQVKRKKKCAFSLVINYRLIRLQTLVSIEEKNINSFLITWIKRMVYFMKDGGTQLFNLWVQLCF